MAIRRESTIDTEAIFVLSSTLMLAVGLAAILFTGKKINGITFMLVWNVSIHYNLGSDRGV
jgi:hypothetical protein